MKFKLFKKFIYKIRRKKLSFHGRVLTGIFILGIFLRLLGTNPGYPLNHPDESTIIGSVLQIALFLNFEPIGYYYGQLLPLIYAVSVVVFFIPILFFQFLAGHLSSFFERGLFGFLEYFRYSQFGYDSDPLHHFYYWSRYESAILSSCAIFVVYLLGKRLFNKETGLIAAFLTAVNYRHVLSSAFALADAPAAFFALLSVFLSTSLLKSQSLRTYLLAGTGLGLALSVKYFVYVIPAFLLCYFMGIWDKPDSSVLEKIKKIIFNKRLLASILWGSILFFIINPYLILDYKRAFWELFVYNVGRYGGGLTHLRPTEAIFPLYYLWWYYLGPVGSVTVLVGSIYAVFRYKMKSIIVLSVVISFMYVFLLIAGGTYMRNYAAVMPFLLFFPAIIIRDFSLLIRRKKIAVYLMVALTLLLGLIPLKDSLTSSYYLSKSHNQTDLIKWMESNIPKSSSIFNIGASLPTNMDLKEIPATYSGTYSFVSMEEVQKSGAEFVVASSFSPVISNFELWKENSLTWGNFFDRKELFNFVDNTYASLVMSEIGDYRIKEFVQPSLFSLDRVFFVARLPSFLKPRKDREIASFVFTNPQKYIDWVISGRDDSGPQKVKFIFNDDTVNNGIVIKDKDCVKPNTQVYSPLFKIDQGEWYTLVGEAVRKYEMINNQYTYNTGFFRLDLFSSENNRLKTYVSRLLRGIDEIQELPASGFAPEGAQYARVVFQLDNCFRDEQYILKNIRVYSAKADFIDKKLYPFYGVPLLKNFIWKYEL